jgi:hypothetical protein
MLVQAVSAEIRELQQLLLAGLVKVRLLALLRIVWELSVVAVAE